METELDNVKVFVPEGMEPDPKSLEQLAMVMRDDRVVCGALMADHQPGYSMPVGGVVAYKDAVSPSGVGYDIGCGNKAVMTRLYASDILADLPDLMDEIERNIAFGMGRSNPVQTDHGLFDQHDAVLRELDSLAGPRMALTQKARAQLGTVGAGNHYVDLLEDETGVVWVANHFGSRGLGHSIAQGFLNLAVGKEFGERGGKERDEPTVFDTDTDTGAFYLAAMTLAGDYAYAGRDLVTDEVLSILGTTSVLEVHNHHNYAWFEDGLWYVRKGATPLTTDLAYIGGSMGDGAVIVRGHELLSGGVIDIGALSSAPHGSGRVMSRTKAAGKVKRFKVYTCGQRDCEFEVSAKVFHESKQTVTCPEHPTARMVKFQREERKSEGVVNWLSVQEDLVAQGVVLRGAGPDEAPEVYKPLDDVIAAHANIDVVYRLRPLGVVMAGPDVFDPYRD